MYFAFKYQIEFYDEIKIVKWNDNIKAIWNTSIVNESQIQLAVLLNFRPNFAFYSIKS